MDEATRHRDAGRREGRAERAEGPGAPDGPGGLESLDGLETKLALGLQFTNMLASINQERGTANAVLLQSLVELLISKGVIHLHELEARKAAVAESLRQSDAETPRVQIAETPDKYASEQEVRLDCAGHADVCKMVCCKLWFVLSVQDLGEGIVRWSYGQPYGIAQREDGYCVHHDPAVGCRIYANRPLVCRTYDCRRDPRIWLDFDQRIPGAAATSGSGGDATA